MYRARKELQCLYPDQDIDYIKFTQDAYYWNPDLYCQIDIADFENYTITWHARKQIRNGNSGIITG